MAARDSHPVVRAALWMSGALFSFILMALAGRELSRELSVFQILFFRSLIGLVILWLLFGRSGFRQFATRRIGLHALRNTSHFVAQYGWFYGIAFIPLAEVFAIEFTLPVWTAVLASLILNERMTKPRITAVVAGLSGAMLILRPGFAAIHIAQIAVLICAFSYALSHVVTKKMSTTESPLAIVFYMTAIQLPMGLFPSLFNWTTPSLGMWPWLLAVGITSLTAHYCIARALRLADASVVIPIDFLRLPLGAVAGYFLYHESVTWFVYAGAALIVGGNMINILSERKKKAV